MKIGALSFKEIATPSQIAQKFYDNDIKVIELGYSEDLISEEIKRIKQLGLDLSVHCLFRDLRLNYSLTSFILNMPYFYFKKEPLKNIEKGFLAAEKLEATHYILHGGVFPKGFFRFKRLRHEEKFLDVFIQEFKSLFIKAKDSKTKIVLENLPYGQIFSKVTHITKVIEQFPWIGFCFDFTHSELTKQTDLLNDLDIDYVHLSDNDFINDLHLSLGQGKLDFTKLFKILKDKRYDGKLIVECKTVSDAIESLEYLKKFI